jgi:outer membrane receptor protein involved in Fe transport
MFRKTLVVRALAVAFGAAALTAAVGPVAYAQTSATGTIFGQVDAAAGTTVVIENLDTAARRTLTPGADGKYQATSMPVGRYKVTLQRNGAAVSTRDEVVVTIGSGSDVSFAAAALQTVQVVGRRQAIDVTSAGSTTTFTATELARLPIANNVGAVIQLAPNTTRGDSRYGGAGAPSFGGAGASENAYYINGFPVTTLLTQVGFSQLPFNAIAQSQLLTGGYGAEFGRSTGGVVNIVTKSGTNDWAIGGAMSIEPNKLRSTPKSTYYEDNGPDTASTNGKVRFYNGLETRDLTSYSIYAGGPLIKDKLFIFVSGENTELDLNTIRLANTGAGAGSSSTGGFQEIRRTTPRGLLKLDWNITDQHHLEYTKVADTVRDNRTYYGFNYATLQRNNVVGGGVNYINWGPTPVAAAQGSEVDILKYTGYLTDDVTLTAVLGKTKSVHEQANRGYNPALPQIIVTGADQIDGFTYPQPQTTVGNTLTNGAADTNKGGRLDLEWRVASKHTLRAGIDYNKIESVAGTALAGGTRWTYGLTDPAVPLDTNTQPTNTVAGNPYAQQGYFVQQDFISSKSTPTVIQTAWYLEDKFQATDRLLLTLGLRNEGFDNRNGDNKTYIKLDRQLAPRLGASWDVKGDSSLAVKASAGRYHVPVPTNVAIRGAGASLFTTQNFVYTGVDPVTGAPTGLTAISPVFSNNNEFGQSKDPRQVAAQNMKGNYQDEFATSVEAALSKDLSVGAKFTYRALKTGIDDHCDDRPFRAWAARNGVDDTNFGYNCALFNPGRANTFTLDVDGDGTLETINLSAADLGVPKIKRKYIALDFFVEHPFDGKWWGKVNYTWSRNTGNTEGQLLSDIGQGDVSTTQAFDFPEFSVNSDGRLPNDRTHQVKAFGYLQATPEFGLGGNFLYASGRPKNCIGNAPDQPPVGGDPEAPYVPGGPVTNYSGYGSAYFFCNGVASTRGSNGNLPADMRLDLNFNYSPAAFKGFKVQVDVFNAFNRQSIETIEERYNTPGGASTVWSRYRTVESYTAPRSVKLSASFNYKF